MQKELITEATNLFPTLDYWQSFLELYHLKEWIKEDWFTEATNRIRRHFTENLNPVWGFEPWGNTKTDTRWFLNEFGSNSLGITFAWKYSFRLKIWDTNRFIPRVVTEALRTSNFSPVLMAFSRIDDQDHRDFILSEERNYLFPSSPSGQITEDVLSWFAAHETESFVNQSVEKVERFTNSVEVTESIRQLNLMAQTAAEQHAQ